MVEIVLDCLKKIVADIDAEVFNNSINDHFNDCWKELSVKERDPNILPELILKNREIIEELMVAVQAYQAGSISLERLRQIKSKLLKDK
ncbi:MAG: hypothetical protein WED07_02180 [Candidatus Freyarchaeum deiterrae]